MNVRSLVSLAAATQLAFSLTHAADAPSAGYFDLGKFTPPKNGGEFVEVNLKGNLLSFAAKVAEKQEPKAAELLKSIESVRVNVVGLDSSNRDELKARAATLRTTLDAQGWERVVSVQKEGNDVGVYTKSRGQDSIAGLVVTVVDDQDQAVFVNIVGDIKPENLAELGERLHIDPLKHAGQAAEKSETKK